MRKAAGKMFTGSRKTKQTMKSKQTMKTKQTMKDMLSGAIAFFLVLGIFSTVSADARSASPAAAQQLNVLNNGKQERYLIARETSHTTVTETKKIAANSSAAATPPLTISGFHERQIGILILALLFSLITIFVRRSARHLRRVTVQSTRRSWK